MGMGAYGMRGAGVNSGMGVSPYNTQIAPPATNAYNRAAESGGGPGFGAFAPGASMNSFGTGMNSFAPGMNSFAPGMNSFGPGMRPGMNSFAGGYGYDGRRGYMRRRRG